MRFAVVVKESERLGRGVCALIVSIQGPCKLDPTKVLAPVAAVT